jgi:hypothetical protein
MDGQQTRNAQAPQNDEKLRENRVRFHFKLTKLWAKTCKCYTFSVFSVYKSKTRAKRASFY